MRTYCSFKNNIILEKYLLILNDEQRVLYTKFRISAHKLEIEKGRYIGLKVEDRICQLCKDDIEDEVHFLLQCPSLQKERWEIIMNINDIRENKKFGNKLRTYCSFRNNIILAKYLLILNDEQRVLYTKFLISPHRLEIEKGRYIGLKVEDRITEFVNYANI